MSDYSPQPDAPAADEPVRASDGGAKRPRKPHRRRRRKQLIAVVISLLFLGGIATASTVGISRVYHKLTEGTADFEGPPGAEKVIQVERGSSIRAIGRTLEEAGVVRTEGSFVAAARDDSRAATLSPGYYRLNLNMPADEALAKMLQPSSRILARIVIPEGKTVAETVARLAKESGIDEADFTKVLANPKSLGLPTWAKNNPEGFLFPATYDVEPNATAASVLAQLVKRFNQALTDTNLESRAAAVGKSPYEVLTIASLVQAESKLAVDMPKIARVIYNRLDDGMRLQLDTTVIYANGGKKSVTTTAEQRALDSPYNTYKIAGLPAGPIASPGQAAIEAALAPAEGDWIFFVAVNPDTGETKYGVTAAEHARNVEEFRAWLRANPGR
ncbi:endolytic transglycosylase MltG [Sporichthya sp.]|uniref:endolytic transglycosylase MltG n=1 Tax=Sporichthya sp. TaxID=65475 RepID=UPI00180BA911|nr:endolytic transglycosylase MltG [Sporichthya sp.]MBA3742542.1 endolytic transglycosylase MltG [Sporichthya sp.]